MRAVAPSTRLNYFRILRRPGAICRGICAAIELVPQPFPVAVASAKPSLDDVSSSASSSSYEDVTKRIRRRECFLFSSVTFLSLAPASPRLRPRYPLTFAIYPPPLREIPRIRLPPEAKRTDPKLERLREVSFTVSPRVLASSRLRFVGEAPPRPPPLPPIPFGDG